MKSILPIIIIFTLSILLFSCNNGILKGSDLSQSDLNFIKQIGLLDEDENLLFFSSQLDNQSSGNLITDKRLASYWIDKNKEDSTINSAFYSEIDSIAPNDLSESFTYASFIKIIKKDGTEFKVYVNDDSKQTKKIFRTAKAQLKKWNPGTLEGF